MTLPPLDMLGASVAHSLAPLSAALDATSGGSVAASLSTSLPMSPTSSLVASLAALGSASGFDLTSSAAVSAGLFYLFGGVTLAGAIGVIVSTHIVRTACCLLASLLGVAALYLLLRADFLAAMQLVVYVGGVLVLIIFGVMLTGQAAALHRRARRGEMIGALLIGGVMLMSIVAAVVAARPGAGEGVIRGAGWTGGAGGGGGAGADAGGSGGVSAAGLETIDVATLGQSLLGDYLVPFELASVLLLVVMIGAAYLARPRERREGEVD